MTMGEDGALLGLPEDFKAAEPEPREELAKSMSEAVIKLPVATPSRYRGRERMTA